MKNAYRLFSLFILSLGLLFFTSAAIVPATVAEKVPVEKTTLSKKELKKQARKQAKLKRLEARLAQAGSSNQKARIQKRIIATKNAGINSNMGIDLQVLEILALIFAFLLPILGLILAIIAKNQGGGLLATLAFWISIVMLILIVLYFIFR